MIMYKNWCKNHIKTNWDKNFPDKNEAYRKIELLKIIKERLLASIPLGP